METAIAMNNDFVECHNNLNKIRLFAEASYSEYQINLKESALKVLKENGTEDDYNFLATEAAKNYMDRAKKSISKIIKTIIKFIEDSITKFMTMITSTKTSKVIDKMEQACEKNPKLRSKKIKYEDTDKKINVIQKGIDNVKKRVSKVDARGFATDDDVKSIDDISEETSKKAAVAGTITGITIGAAIILLTKYKNKSDIEAKIGDATKVITEPGDGLSKDPTTSQFYTKVAQTLGEFIKEKVRCVIHVPTTVINNLRDDMSGSTDVEGSGNVQTESVNFNDLPMFQFVVENCDETDDTDESSDTEETVTEESMGVVEGLDLDAYFTELCDDLFTEKDDSDDNDTESDDIAEPTDTDDITESTDTDTTTIDAALYLEQLESEILGSDEDVLEESTDDTSNDDASRIYMEQLEREIFGDTDEVVEENTEADVKTEDESDESDDIESLLDEMESLL
jgi:hypothetical protein